jgi:hypothetical protein
MAPFFFPTSFWKSLRYGRVRRARRRADERIAPREFLSFGESMFARKLTLVTALALAATAIAFVPSAEAHICTAQYPSTSCGQCGGLSPYHDHRYVDGRIYCQSIGPIIINTGAPVLA